VTTRRLLRIGDLPEVRSGCLRDESGRSLCGCQDCGNAADSHLPARVLVETLWGGTFLGEDIVETGFEGVDRMQVMVYTTPT